MLRHTFIYILNTLVEISGGETTKLPRKLAKGKNVEKILIHLWLILIVPSNKMAILNNSSVAGFDLLSDKVIKQLLLA